MSTVSKSIAQKWLLPLIVILILALRFEFVANNVWSLHYLRHVANSFPTEPELSLPPLSHQRATLWLAQTALRHGDLTGAKTLLTPLAAQGDALAISALGEVFLTQGNFQGAIEKWDEIENAARIAQVARQAATSGQLDNALLAYEANLRFNPERGVLQLANFLWEKKDDRPAAETVLRQALVDYPESYYRAQWLRRLATYLKSEEQWDEAETLYRQILAEDEENTAVWIDLGWALYNRGDGAATAQTIFEQAIAINPKQGEAYFAMAQMLSKANRYSEADAWFQLAVARSPDKIDWYLVRANAQRTGGNLPLALDLYQQIITRFPDSAQAYYEQAWAYRLDEQMKEATNSIEQAIQLLDKFDPRYYIRAGTIYEWTNETETAVNYYNLVLDQSSNNRAALNGLQRLEDSR